MGLVDGEQRDAAAFQQLQAAVGQEPFGRDVQQVELAIQEGLLDIARLTPFLCRVQVGRPHAELGQGVDLVLHQRDEGGHHHPGAFAHQRRHLVAQRFAAARGHQHQGVAATDDVLDDGLLVAAEGFVAKNALQDALGAWVRHGR